MAVRTARALPWLKMLDSEIPPELTQRITAKPAAEPKVIPLRENLIEIRHMISSKHATPAETVFRQNFEALLFEELAELIARYRHSHPNFEPSLEELRYNREITRVLTKIKLRLGMATFERQFGGPDVWKVLSDKELEGVLARFVNYCHDGSIERRALAWLKSRAQ